MQLKYCVGTRFRTVAFRLLSRKCVQKKKKRPGRPESSAAAPAQRSEAMDNILVECRALWGEPERVAWCRVH